MNTNYVDRSSIMKVKLQAQHVWEVVEYDVVVEHKDRCALQALLAAVPPEMGPVLAK